MIFIITKNHQQFLACCHDLKTSPKNPLFKFVHNPAELRGVIGIPIILYGQYYMHPLWEEINATLKTRQPVFLKGDIDGRL